MKFNDLDLYNNHLNKKIIKDLKNTISENNFIFGKSVIKLENTLSNLTGSKYAITLASGTDALLLSLMSLNLKADDEIIIPAFSWLSILEVVLLLKLKPKFVDINKNSFNCDIKKIENTINKKTRVIVSTSLFGRSADLEILKNICNKNNIVHIEDAAQNFGSYIKNQNSCNIAHITCTSFFPSKNLGAFGDGGAIFTNNKIINNKIIKLRNHGQHRYNESKFIGVNSRIGSIQASILNSKLKDFKNKKKRQQTLYKKYCNFFDKNNITGFTRPRHNREFNDMNSQFSMIVKKRNLLIKYLKKYKINYKIYYSKPLYRQFSYKKKVYLENTEFVCKKIISLPFNDISISRFSSVLKKLQKIISKDRGIFFEKK